MIDKNATCAAKAAGYSAVTAKQIGRRLLINVDVQVVILTGMSILEKRTQLKADDVLREFQKLRSPTLAMPSIKTVKSIR